MLRQGARVSKNHPRSQTQCDAVPVKDPYSIEARSRQSHFKTLVVSGRAARFTCAMCLELPVHQE